MIEIGDRVGAIFGGRDGAAKHFGTGVYAGRQVPEGDRGERSMATILAKAKATSPKIELDTGEVVYGCECWWGSEAIFNNKVKEWEEAGWEIRQITVKEALSPSEEGEVEVK